MVTCAHKHIVFGLVWVNIAPLSEIVFQCVGNAHLHINMKGKNTYHISMIFSTAYTWASLTNMFVVTIYKTYHELIFKTPGIVIIIILLFSLISPANRKADILWYSGSWSHFAMRLKVSRPDFNFDQGFGFRNKSDNVPCNQIWYEKWMN